MDLSNLMQMAGKLRAELERAQSESAAVRVRGEAGGGLVAVVMDGNHEVVELKIDPKVFGAPVDPDALRLLEDLLRAAFNQAAGGVAKGLQERMGSLAAGLGLDPSLLDGLKK